VEVLNANPSVELEGATVSEGDSVVLQGSYSDPGVADTHTATVDWSDDSAGAEALDLTAGGDGTGTFTVERTLGDDGTFDVTVEITDDDGGTATTTATVQVSNSEPQLTVGGDTVQLPGGSFAVVRPGDSTTITADATDPGSDDLTFDWSTGRTATYYNDGVGEDPDPSPGPVFPAAASDASDLTASEPGVQAVDVVVSDDDGASVGGQLVVLTTGELTESRTKSWWLKQFRQKGSVEPEEDLLGMLAFVEAASTVFGDESAGTPLGSLQAAGDALRSSTVSARILLEQQLLVSWLNIASGGSQLDTEYWSETGPKSAVELLTEAEALWADPDSTDSELYDAMWSVSRI
jgi:hypothetical protein